MIDAHTPLWKKSNRVAFGLRSPSTDVSGSSASWKGAGTAVQRGDVRTRPRPRLGVGVRRAYRPCAEHMSDLVCEYREQGCLGCYREKVAVNRPPFRTEVATCCTAASSGL